MSAFGVGYCTLKHYGVVDRFLDPGLKREMSTFSVQGGGSAANSTVVLARWGVETRFCGATGSDMRGDKIESTLADEGIDTDDMIRQPGAVSQFSFTVLEESSGRRQTLYTHGSVSNLEQPDAENIDLEGCTLLLVDGLEPAFQTELAQRASQRDIPIVLHASEMDPGAENLVRHCDYLIASERFATRFTGVGELDSLCHELLDLDTKAAVVTLGRDGVVGAWSGEMQMRLDAYEVDVVDNSGAGDVFAGAIAYGVLEEWPCEKILRFANVAGALSCKGLGPRGLIPDREEVKRPLES